MPTKKTRKPARKAGGARPARPAPRPARGGEPVTPAVAPTAFSVVGVGASAGGLEAFSQLLRAAGDLRHFAIVFVQHLSPEHESALVPLLSAQTTVPVVQAREGMMVDAGHLYVIPPNVQMRTVRWAADSRAVSSYEDPARRYVLIAATREDA
jgi:two-component system CheB/CheR fusion protein